MLSQRVVVSRQYHWLWAKHIAFTWDLRRSLLGWPKLAITRSLTDMEQEIKELGLELPTSPYGKQELSQLLGKFYWEKAHPGKPMPRFISPMLIKNLRDLEEDKQQEIWESKEWWAEIKRNGLRITGYFENPPRFHTRGVSVQTYIPGEVTSSLWWLQVPPGPFTDSIVDGEIISVKKQIDTSPYVAGGKGTVTNNVLQAAVALLSIENSEAAQKGNGMPLRYVLYDIMRCKGQDVMKFTYKQRRELLTAFFAYLEPIVGQGYLVLNDTTNLNKRQFYEDVIRKGGEGVVMKWEKGVYKEGPTRTQEQYKVKRQIEVDAVVTGFTPPRKGSTFEKEGLIGGLTFSVKDITDGKFYEVGSVSNIPMEMRQDFSVKNEDGTLKGLKPAVYNTVWEVQGMEYNRNLLLSHLRIIRPRTGVDAKSPEECTYDRQAILRSLEEAPAA